MSAEIDDLAQLELDIRTSLPLSIDLAAVAHHIAKWLHKDGYRKPQIVESEDDSDRLPVGSFVLDANGDVARKFPSGWRTLVTEPDGTAWLSGCMEDAELPATVLHKATE